MQNAPILKRSPFAPLWKSAVKSILSRARDLPVAIIFPDGERIAVNGGETSNPVEIHFHRWSAIRTLFFAGELGIAEAYVLGDWSCSDLPRLINAVANQKDIAPHVPLIRTLRSWKDWIWHRLHANTLRGSKRNIAYHYDLGNAFYSEWLDETMTYSSAIFEHEDEPLSEAQKKKYARIAKAVGLQQGESVLEIGCGWGGFAEYAAREFGARITCLTLSKEQAAFARERMIREGLDHLVEIRIQDYREVEGEFDRIVSIEMFEAVGEEHWPTYFATISKRLRNGGKAALQIITMADERFEHYRRNVDFIQRHIFPGGMLPSPSVLKNHVQSMGLALRDQHFFGISYAETLRIWREKFTDAWPRIQPMGFDQIFKRKWTWYLAYCEGGFRTGRIDVGQFVLEKT